MGAYTLAEVSRICRVPKSRLRYWQRTALLEPRRAPESDIAFGFGDLVSVKAVLALLERGVPLRDIRRSVEAVRTSMPDVESPLGALRLWHEKSQRVVVRHRGALVEPDGQTVLDFGVPAERAKAVSSLAVRPAKGPGASAGAAGRSALDWFERGCQLDSDRATYADAIDSYEHALELEPDLADAHCNLGAVYFNQDRRARARDAFLRAIEIEPQHLEAHLNLATLFEEEGQEQSALRHFKIALRADPLNADTHVSLGFLYEKLGLPRNSRNHWRRYLQLDPGGNWADVARRHVED